jgi:ribosomal protein S18 acetylase RimI-like enzyme
VEITKIDDFEEIFMNREISALLGTSMFNPTFGKIQNIAQTVYAKTQGRFYICKIDGLLVGLIGFSKIDNHMLVVRHLAVLSTFQRQKIGTELIKFAIEDEKVKVVTAETDDEGVGFYKGFGFTAKKLPFNDATGQRYACTFEVERRS